VNAPKTNRIAVIMRSKNSDWVIDQTLAALFSQDFREFELLVVDSGSTDRTLEIVRQYPCRLIEIAASAYYPGAVLNSAIEQTDCDLLVFVNSDAVALTQHTLSRIVGAFDDSQAQAAFARQLPRPEADTWVRRDYAVSFPASAPAPPWMTFSLPFAALRRSAWEKHRFYSDAWGSEDTEWGCWARKNGFPVLYVPDALVMHSHNYTLRQLYGRRFIEGEADAFIYRKTETLLSMIGRFLRSAARDGVDCLFARDMVGLALAAPRRWVYHWAHYQGRRLGMNRMRKGNTDASVGQKIVLERHESIERKRTP
jgi:rhamnosyltransferase